MIINQDIEGFTQFSDDISSILTRVCRANEWVSGSRPLEGLDYDIESAVKPEDYAKIKHLSIEEFKERKEIHNKAKEKFEAFTKTFNEQELRESLGDNNFFDPNYCVSREKSNNVINPKSVGDRKEWERCQIEGLRRGAAQMFTNVIRGFSVQCQSHIERSAATLCVKGLTQDEEEMMRHYEKSIFGDQYKAMCTRRQKKREKEINDHNKVSALTVTDMPDKFKINPQKDSLEINFKQRLKLMDIMERNNRIVKDMGREKRSEYKEKYVQDPPLFLDKVKTKRAESAIKKILDNWEMSCLSPPLYLFTIKYMQKFIEQELIINDKDLSISFRNRNSVIDIWSLYYEGETSELYYGKKYLLIHSDGNTLEFVNELPTGFKKFSHNDKFYLKDEVGTFVNNTKYYLNMLEYSEQTRSTPILYSSANDETRHLINKNSYCKSDLTKFSFSCDANLILDVLNSFTSEYVTFKPIYMTSNILIGDEKIFSVTLFRQDCRPHSLWKHTDCKSFPVLRSSLIKIFSNETNKTDYKSSKYVCEFFTDTGFVRVSHENFPIEYYIDPNKISSTDLDIKIKCLNGKVARKRKIVDVPIKTDKKVNEKQREKFRKYFNSKTIEQEPVVFSEEPPKKVRKEPPKKGQKRKQSSGGPLDKFFKINK